MPLMKALDYMTRGCVSSHGWLACQIIRLLYAKRYNCAEGAAEMSKTKICVARKYFSTISSKFIQHIYFHNPEQFT